MNLLINNHPSQDLYPVFFTTLDTNTSLQSGNGAADSRHQHLLVVMQWHCRLSTPTPACSQAMALPTINTNTSLQSCNGAADSRHQHLLAVRQWRCRLSTPTPACSQAMALPWSNENSLCGSYKINCIETTKHIQEHWRAIAWQDVR